jgi:hypothetical protein
MNERNALNTPAHVQLRAPRIEYEKRMPASQSIVGWCRAVTDAVGSVGGVATHAALWFWNAEVSADLSGEVVIDFRVPWNRRCLAGGTDENRMVGAFPEQPTQVLLQVADQRAPFHALTLSGSRITGPWPVAC